MKNHDMKNHVTDEEWEKEKREYRKLQKMNAECAKDRREFDAWLYSWGYLLTGVLFILLLVFFGDFTNLGLLGHIFAFLVVAFFFGTGLFKLKWNKFLKKVESGDVSEEEISSKSSKATYIGIFLLFVFGFIIIAATVFGFLSGRAHIFDIIRGLFGVFAIGVSVWLFSVMRKIRKYLPK